MLLFIGTFGVISLVAGLITNDKFAIVVGAVWLAVIVSVKVL